MSDLTLFDYSGRIVRTVTVNGEPWFVAVDVCDVLDIRNVADAVSTLDDDEKGIASVDTLGGPQRVIRVSEPGLYSLILRSRKPEAKAFKRWVTHEVLPAIRKTGSFVANLTPRQMAELILAESDRADREAEARALAETKVAVLEPAAQAWDELVDTGTTLDVAAAAKKLCENGIVTGQNRLYKYLRDIGWVFKNSTQPMQSAVDTGWLTVDWGKKFTNLKTGEEGQGQAKSRVTAKGLAELQRRLSIPQIGEAS